MAKSTRKVPALTRVKSFLARHWWAVAAGLVALTVVALIATFLSAVPLPTAAPGSQSTRILAVDGQLIGTLHAEQNRQIVPLDAISMNLQNAVISTEDRDFYNHPGISLKGIIRAAFSNAKGGAGQQGGSTLTQQYVRNAFVQVGRQRTILRKVKEAIVAIKIERKFSKKKILGFYLNTVYFGRGAYGAEAAAQTYFKKPAKNLDLSQAAYLAGIIRAPEIFQKDKNPKGVVKIRDEVLNDMVAAGHIDRAAAEDAKKQDLLSQFHLGASIEQDSPRAGYFINYIRKLLLTDFKISQKDIFGGGLKVHTTLDLRMQDAAEAAVKKVLNKPDDPEAALLAMDTQGNVKAMVGGRVVDNLERNRQYNYAVAVPGQQDSGRQAGSAFKPFTLATFVNEGFSVQSTFAAPPEIKIDSKQCRNKDGTAWDVSNFDNETFGPLNVVDATVHSVNTVYAQMMDKITPRKFVALATKMGIVIPQGYLGCALTLGTSPVTPYDLARAYTAFAGRGQLPDGISISKIEDAGGKVIAERKTNLTKVFDENVADSVNMALAENIKRGTGTAAKLNRPAAGKTGTAQNHTNAWFAGYTPDLTAVVWMGFPPKDGQIQEMQKVHGIRVTGATFPAQIWKEFMQVAVKGMKVSNFVGPQLTGQVINGVVSACGTTASPTASASNVVISTSPTPCPSVSPSATSSTSPSPTAKAQPSPPASPSPTPHKGQSPSPSPSSSPTPSPSASP